MPEGRIDPASSARTAVMEGRRRRRDDRPTRRSSGSNSSAFRSDIQASRADLPVLSLGDDLVRQGYASTLGSGIQAAIA